MKNPVLLVLAACLWSGIGQSQSYKNYSWPGFMPDTLERQPEAVTFDNEGNAYHVAYAESWSDVVHGLSVFKVNPSGQRIASFFYTYLPNDSIVTGGQEMSVRDIMFHGGAIYMFVEALNHEDMNSEIEVVKFNKSLQVVWRMPFRIPQQSINRVKMMPGPSGSVITVSNVLEGILLLKYSPNGALLDSTIYKAGPAAIHFAHYAGYFNHALYIGGLRKISGTFRTEMLKFDDNFNLQWASAYKVSPVINDDEISGLAIDNAGNPFISGAYGNELCIKPFVIAYDPVNGTRKWVKRISYTNTKASAVFTDNTGNPYIWVKKGLYHTHDRFIKLNKSTGAIIIDKQMFKDILLDYGYATLPLSNVEVFAGCGPNNIYATGSYRTISQEWNPWCQCYEEVAKQGFIIVQVHSSGTIGWQHKDLSSGFWDTEIPPAVIRVSATRIYYQGKHFNNFEPVDYIYYGAFSSTTGSRMADGMDETTDGRSTINIYPNPATDEISVSWTAFAEDNVTLTIRNAGGAVVSEQKVSAGTSIYKIETAHLQPGMYILECNVAEARMTKRFIIAER